MSSAATNEPRPEKRSSRTRVGGGGAGKSATGNASSTTAKLKILVRKLPPAMTQDEFKAYMAEWIDLDSIEYLSFSKGKMSEDRAKASRHAGASIKFKTQEQIIALREGIDGRIFTDSKGNQTRPQVEFAPFQKIPKKVTKHDARQGTIDQDPEYIAFLEILKTGAPLQAASTLPSINPAAGAADGMAGADKPLDKPTSTPLIEYIRAQKAAGASAIAAEKAAKKEKESRREKRLAERKSKVSGKGAIEKEKEREREREKEKATQRVVKLAVRVANSESITVANRRARNTQETPVTPTLTIATSTAPDTGKTSTPQGTPGTPGTPSASTKPPRRDRGTAAIAAAILQRDLGLGGPLQRKDRRGGGGNTQATTISNIATNQTSGEGSTQPAEASPQFFFERAPSESGSQSQQKSSRRNRRRDRGGQGGRDSNPSIPTSEPLMAPISILKKHSVSLGEISGGNSASHAPPQILKRENSTALNPPDLSSTTAQSPAAPATSQPSATIAQQTAAPAQSHTGPRGSRGPRPPRGMRGSNNVPAIKTSGVAGPGANYAPNPLNQPVTTVPTTSTPTPTTPSNQPTTPTVTTKPSAVSPGNVPSGPAASAGSNAISQGHGGRWQRGAPRGGGFSIRGVSGRGGRGRGGGGGMRGGPQVGNSTTAE